MRRFKELFCRSLPPPPPPQIKLVDFGVKVQVQINNKKINWTPRGKAALLSSQGDKFYTFYKKYNTLEQIKFTISCVFFWKKPTNKGDVL